MKNTWSLKVEHVTYNSLEAATCIQIGCIILNASKLT